MPKPAPPPRTDLDEVERAISLLEGRHPEHERARRETMTAADERRRALERELAERARRRRVRQIVVAASVIVAASAASFGWKIAARARGLRAVIVAAEAPFTSHGLSEVASNELSAGPTLDADVPGDSCFVALATGGASIRVREGATSAEAKGSVGWCSCAAGHATIEAQPSGQPVGLALLRVDAQTIGGPLARPWVEFAPAAWANGAAECADAMLQGWLTGHHGPKIAADEGWLAATPQRARLRRSGFHVVAGVEPGKPFGIVEASAGECMLAVAAADDELALRAADGTTRVQRARGAVAWCSANAATSLVWRDGKSPVVVIAAPAARVGGLLGTRECAEEAGLRLDPTATWMADDDLVWDAGSVLRASKLADVVAAALPGEPSGSDARVVALALSPAARVTSTPPATVIACDPPLDGTARVREVVCAHPAPVAWWRQTDAPAAGARAPLPPWLAILDGHHEPDAVERIPELLALARRLVRQGFEPTVLEGVTELGAGVRVVGRGGEDAIVAVGLGPMRPWVFPYTDRLPWDLGDEPREIPLRPGEAIELTSTPPPNAPREKRRTVVFRHTAIP